MFRHLRTKLTVLYASLFGVSLLLAAAAVYTAIASNAERAVRRGLQLPLVGFNRHEGCPGQRFVGQIFAAMSNQLEECVVRVADPAQVIAKDDADHVRVDHAPEADIALAQRPLVIGQPRDFLMGSDTAGDPAIGRAQRRDARHVEASAPLDADRRFMAAQRRQMAMNQGMVFAAIQEDIRKRSSDGAARLDSELLQQLAPDERDDETLVGRPDRGRQMREQLIQCKIPRIARGGRVDGRRPRHGGRVRLGVAHWRAIMRGFRT